MAIDASIISGLRSPQLESPVNALAQMLQVQGAQQQNQLGQAKLDEYERSKTRQNKLLQLVQGLPANATDEQRIGAMKGGGYFDEADKLEASMLQRQRVGAEVTKANADASKTAYETLIKQTDTIGQTLGALRGMSGVTPQYVASTLQHLGDIGAIPKEHLASALSQIPQDPAQLPAWLAQKQQATMSTLDQMKFTTPDANTIANNATSRANNAATVAASRENAAATRAVAAATRDAARIQRDQGTEMKLADDYRNQSKGFKEVSDAYLQISATLDKATMSPAATLAAATKFMKLLDPGSVVRESELGMALAATGAIDRLTNYTNTLKYGKVLTSQQVDDFRNITKQIYGAAQTQQQKIDANYRQQATTYGLRPEVIIQDLGQNAPAAKNAAAPSAGAPPSKNSRGWTLMRDAQGNQAYVSPDGKQHEEVR